MHAYMGGGGGGGEGGEGSGYSTNLVSMGTDQNVDHEWVDGVGGASAVLHDSQLL